MHHDAAVSLSQSLGFFQFPLLGIFPCTIHPTIYKHTGGNCLSIPVTWDFSMHLRERRKLLVLSPTTLSIPVTWDFSMHLPCSNMTCGQANSSFNSRYLGFFHAPNAFVNAPENCGAIFQFPLLGIFPCTLL